jgi:hypothetical protein
MLRRYPYGIGLAERVLDGCGASAVQSEPDAPYAPGRRKTVNVAYWIVAGLLALFYLYGGGLKAVRSREQLRPMMAWVDGTPMPAVRTIGLIELLGAIGLILPPLTGVAPWLAPAAAVGFVLLQIGAIRVHLSLGDRKIALNVTLLLVAAVTVWLAAVGL